MALKIPYVIMIDIVGQIKSITAISLLNLVKILPIGFESKKSMFARKTFSVIALCMLVVVLRKILNIVVSLKIQLKPKNNIMPIIIKG